MVRLPARVIGKADYDCEEIQGGKGSTVQKSETGDEENAGIEPIQGTSQRSRTEGPTPEGSAASHVRGGDGRANPQSPGTPGIKQTCEITLVSINGEKFDARRESVPAAEYGWNRRKATARHSAL